MISGIEQRHITARDGTRVGYQVRGSGPCVVLANGLGGRYIAFRHLYDELEGYRVISWDYRGLYSSDAPADPRANTVADQVEDLFEILAAEGVDQIVIAGWSMGVQVAFETFRGHAPRIRGVLAINGTYGRAFRTVLGSKMIGQTIPTLLKLVKSQSGLVGWGTRQVVRGDGFIHAMIAMGLVARTVDMEVFRATAAGFQSIDWRIYSDLLARLDEHDAEDQLAGVAVPTAIVTGDRDLMTPPATAEHLHRAIAGSRLCVVTGGSHYTPIEYPEIVKAELRALLARVPGWAPAAAAATRGASPA
jgi:pimeloyl-ACP methyl ester carboxylesterase